MSIISQNQSDTMNLCKKTMQWKGFSFFIFFSPHSKPNKENPTHLRSDCLQTFEAKEGDSKGKRLISRVTFHLHKQVTIGHCGMSVNGFHYRNSA